MTLITHLDTSISRVEYEEKFKCTLVDFGERWFRGIRLPFTPPASILNRVLNRILNILFEYPDIEYYLRSKQIVEKNVETEPYDLLISIAVPHSIHWGIARFKSIQHIARTWIADCGDPYMGVTYNWYRRPFWFKYLERKFCKKADFITIPLESARNAYYKEFRSKLEVIPQGFNFGESRRNLRKYIPNKVPTFAYAGNIIPGLRDLRPVCDWLIDQEEDFLFKIYTRSHDLLKEYEVKSRKRIKVSGVIPREQLLSELSEMDFLINLENSTNKQSPSKLIDYWIVGRPVLSLFSFSLDIQLFKSFMVGDFSKAIKEPNLSKYDIKTICGDFLKLSRDTHE